MLTFQTKARVLELQIQGRRAEHLMSCTHHERQNHIKTVESMLVATFTLSREAVPISLLSLPILENDKMSKTLVGIITLSLMCVACFPFTSAQSNRLTNTYDYPLPLDLLALKTDAPVSSLSTTTLPSLEEMEYYVHFVTVVYGKYDTNTNLDCEACQLTGPNVTLVKVAMNRLANTLALINVNEVKGEVIVTFRGSVNLENYILNGLMVPIPVKFAGSNGVKVHGGFYVAADSIYGQIEETLRTILTENPTYRLVFVGHSLGAPLAVLTALRIRSQLEFTTKEFAIFSYGSPRIGNKAFADYVNTLNVTIVRVVNKGDLVAHIPMRSIQPIFIHHQNEVWLTPNNTIKICSREVYEDPTCSNSLGPKYNTQDHTTGYFGTDFIPSVTDNWCAFLMQILVNVPPFLC